MNFGKYQTEFLNLGVKEVPHQRGGIAQSEALMIYTLIKELGVDVLIESGVRNGKSTEIWGLTLSDVKVYALDAAGKFGVKESKMSTITNTKKRLKNYEHIEFLYRVNSHLKIPELISENEDKRIGIFIDGPKGTEGFDLCRNLLNHKSVHFTAQHDYTFTNDKKHMATRSWQQFYPNSNWREIADSFDKDVKYNKSNGPGLYCTIK